MPFSGPPFLMYERNLWIALDDQNCDALIFRFTKQENSA